MPLFGDLYDVVFNRENEVLEMALKWGRVLLAAIMLTGTSVGYGAQYELRSPFAISCEGRIDSKGGEYFFARDHKVKSDSDDNELICSLATIAEKTTKTPLYIFGPNGAAMAQPAIDVKSLHAKIGELTLENDFLEGALTKRDR